MAGKFHHTPFKSPLTHHCRQTNVLWLLSLNSVVLTLPESVDTLPQMLPPAH